MTAMTDAWPDKRGELMQSVDNVTDVLRRIAEPRPPTHDATFDATLFATRRRGRPRVRARPRRLRQGTQVPAADASGVPARTGGQEATLRHTLDAMADGGIRDQLGGGFHRYSTDARWLVPHFEIMLYDQAMLAPVYGQASAR